MYGLIKTILLSRYVMASQLFGSKLKRHKLFIVKDKKKRKFYFKARFDCMHFTVEVKIVSVDNT